jgi:hypothetical protein
MKSSTKKWLFCLTIITCFLVAAVLFSMSRFNLLRSDDVPYGGNASYPGWDVTFYTQHANAIIIGEVQTVSDPYIPKDIIKVEQEAQIDVHEVLKGNPGMSTLTVTDLVGLVDLPSDPNAISLEGIVGLLKPQEKVLLFLGKTPEGNYVPLAGPYSKFLVDQEGDYVTRIGDFRMSFKELKAQIQEAVKLPVREQKFIPVEEMY